MQTRTDMEFVITEVTNQLESEEILYHIDASSSLYVHEMDFYMDDLDATVQ